MDLDRWVLSAAFPLLVALSPARSAAEDTPSGNERLLTPSGAKDPPGTTRSPTPVFDPTQPIPPGFHVEDRPPSPLITIGGLVHGLAYTPAVLEGAGTLEKSYSGCPTNRWLLLPVAGPFVAATRLGGRPGNPCDDPEGVGVSIFVFDGIVQLAGVVLLAAGIGATGPALVKDTAKSDSTTGASNGPHWHVIPWHAGASGTGVDLVGTF